jgi:hypothetical protein
MATRRQCREAADLDDQPGGTGPGGLWMAGFLLNKSPAEASTIARQQRALAGLAGDAHGHGWWNQVVTYLAATGRLITDQQETPVAGTPTDPMRRSGER